MKTKEELFKKYSINKSHDVWDNTIDNWMSVEIYRLMHDGALPPKGDASVEWVIEFLDKTDDMKYMAVLMRRKDWGSLYLTAKRMVFAFADQLIEPETTEP